MYQRLNAEGMSSLAEYWSDRVDETASDVLGILNMGPVAGIGLIGYFRSFSASERLRNEGPERDPHPADILRAFLAVEVVALLRFGEAKEWSKVIADEADKDVSAIELEGASVATADARKSAAVVAETVVRARLNALENHALGRIQNWRDLDEAIVDRLCETIRSGASLPDAIVSGTYAAHVVAATTVEALRSGSDVGSLFRQMIAVLKVMHDANSSWGPLYVRHPSDVARHQIRQNFDTAGHRRADKA